MGRREPPEGRQRPQLTVPLTEAQQRLIEVIERGRPHKGKSVNESRPAHHWYKFAEELLKTLFTTDALADEFAGRGTVKFGTVDTDVTNYITRLESIYERLEFFGTEHPRTIDPPAQPYVDQNRLGELRGITPQAYDLTKLIRLCEELNICYADGCYLATAMLVRAILDHVPPIFGAKTFSEVASNYPGGRSFKASMQQLEGSSRKIADAHLHMQIRSKEVLPNRTQVNVSPDLDVLLAEIVRLLK